jgi:hypothetical protein
VVNPPANHGLDQREAKGWNSSSISTLSTKLDRKWGRGNDELGHDGSCTENVVSETNLSNEGQMGETG